MRSVAWFLILFQVLFLNLFVPGHTRGAITLSGSSGPGCADCRVVNQEVKKEVAACCEAKTAKDGKHVPTSEERRCCAVCYLASAYIPVDPLVVYVDFRGLIRLSHEQAVAQVRSLDFPAPFWPIGPPALVA